MGIDKDRSLSSAEELRRLAEEQLNSLSPEVQLPQTDHELQRLVHELQVHQVELELQNSELRTARDEVETALEKYTDLYDFAPVGYFTLDRTGNIRTVNLSGAGFLGTERSRLIGQRLGQFIAVSDRPALISFLEKLFASPGKELCEEVLATEEDFPRFIQLEGAAATSGQECRIALIDITVKQLAMQDTLKIEKLESLGILAGGIAHDFNNFLTAILGNISLARIQVLEPDKVAHRLEAAEKAAVRAKDLTQKLLTFAKGGEPLKKAINVNGLIKEAADFAIHGSSAICELCLADHLWPVDVDESQLSQVIQNLVLNAVQSMPDGGKITIVTHNSVLLPEGENTIEISIADTGDGIPVHLVQRIFEPYFTTKYQGRGLGLATCYSIIKKHGGNIRVESSGQGTTFYISLPASNLAEEAVPVSSHEVNRRIGRILVMDDEETLREIVTAMLEELGYQVECTENGTEAVNLYRQRKSDGTPFAAVIMDLTIPGGVGGREAITSLLQFDPKVKAIVSSGYSADPVMSSYRDYGFCAVLCKPYRLQEMSEVLRELLDPTPIES